MSCRGGDGGGGGGLEGGCDGRRTCSGCDEAGEIPTADNTEENNPVECTGSVI